MRHANGPANRTWLWFLLLCILPLAVLLILAGSGWNPGWNLLFLAVFLICPISMFFLMRHRDSGREAPDREVSERAEADRLDAVGGGSEELPSRDR